MHAATLSNVARRRFVHGASIQTVAAASTSATATSQASPVHDASNVPRSRNPARESHRDATLCSRDVSTSSRHFVRPSRQGQPRTIPLSLPSFGVQHVRALHSSSAVRRPDPADPHSLERRRHEVQTSSWSRPPRPSQDADDNVVPSYYLERKKQRDDISQRKEEEGGLMNELNAGILAEGLAAEVRTREEKIPVEVRLPDGTVRHPSGFEPPTAETEFHPVAAKVPTEEHPLLATVKQQWGEAAVERGSGAEPIKVDKAREAEWIERMVADGNGGNGVVSAVSNISRLSISPEPSPPRPLSLPNDDPDSVVPRFYAERRGSEDGLMHELVGDEVAAQMRGREEKIPVEVTLDDGSVAHPSGFVPPTAETDFHPMAAKPGDVPKQPWIEVLGGGSGNGNGNGNASGGGRS